MNLATATSCALLAALFAPLPRSLKEFLWMFSFPISTLAVGGTAWWAAPALFVDTGSALAWVGLPAAALITHYGRVKRQRSRYL